MPDYCLSNLYLTVYARLLFICQTQTLPPSFLPPLLFLLPFIGPESKLLRSPIGHSAPPPPLPLAGRAAANTPDGRGRL